MIAEGTRWGYIIAAYGSGVAIIGALIVWSWLQSRRAKNELARMEARAGGRRRAKG